jgi:uncharacterized protein (DUF362 family)
LPEFKLSEEITRRNFLKVSGIVGGAVILVGKGGWSMTKESVPVAFLKTANRSEGVKTCIRALRLNPVKGKQVFIKPNFNTADPTPG